jgi:hypothetical protein
MLIDPNKIIRVSINNKSQFPVVLPIHIAGKIVENVIRPEHTKFFTNNIRLKIGVYNIIIIFAICTIFCDVVFKKFIDNNSEIIMNKHDIPNASRFVSSPVTSGRVGAFILSIFISNISFIIILFVIISNVITMETMKLVDLISVNKLGNIINPLDMDSKKVGRIFSVRIIFIKPDVFFSSVDRI